MCVFDFLCFFVCCFCLFAFLVSGFDTLVEDAVVDTNSPVFGNRPEHFRSFSETPRSNQKFRKFSETEFVGVLGGASFGTNL